MKKQEWSKTEINFVLKLYKRGITRGQITKLFNNKFYKKRTQDSIKHCIESYGSDIEKDLPKVLVIDIETKPIVAKVWGLFDQTIGLNQIVDEGGIFCWSAKWLGSKEVIYKDVKGNPKKEKELLKPLWKLMDEADIILGQNSNSFDIKKLNAKFLEHNLGSPSEYKKIDTKLLAKKHFSFISNKLEYMSKKFCSQKKLSHKKFPGFSLWEECSNGNLSAWREMERYNKADVLATEELFVILSEFDKSEIVTSAMRSYTKNKSKK